MIKLYFTKSSSTCRKAREWLINNKLPFQEINLTKATLSHKEIYHILSLTEAGTDDIISKRAAFFQDIAYNFEDLSLTDAVSMIKQNISLLRIPLIVDDSHIQVGFNEDEVRKFVPRPARKVKKGLLDKKLYEIHLEKLQEQ
ncbi:transcriptional regulator, Spx/MgsR family [Lactococcus cremoris]|uniref:Arsenate reductase n=1 Tax=Lactococcus cremoris subsp. cremoris IBB477 TaxID=1449093 RepID=A0A1E7G3V8_LACLC|nr:Spx/MgsR family RNA polymerase-binding regulatory protein [Lactococcus cremoris]KKW70115.1 transcriptional regulator, Spx/MgsR family [Lactococcus cremoris]KZK09165.1 Transcriptional regulator SpxA1 [Lactococcus cremoris]MCD6632040.1 Spx/MgsR family RNA polymerase-binding regulatory protein [Lactococcus cremoris]MDU8932347.1 Regulatory protein Spx [Lactococcus cremoris]OEU39650.1 arsenate reductase [Lactococcus cremoris subsp. cremoris IBB477]